MRYTVINHRGMIPVATTLDMPTALAWAETVPAHSDFAIVAHTAHDLRPYRPTELRLLHARLTDTVSRPLRMHLTHDELVARVVDALAAHAVTTDPPPARSRVAPLTDQEDYDMATTKKTRSKKATTKKTASKKTTARKAPAKKVAASKAAPAKRGRTSRNDEKKIQVLNKEHGARAGTKRATMLDIVLASDTVADAKANGAGWIDVKFAVERGLIKLN